MMNRLLLLLAVLATANASIFLPTAVSAPHSLSSSSSDAAFHRRRSMDRVIKSRGWNAKATSNKPLAMAIPGNGVAEQVIVGG